MEYRAKSNNVRVSPQKLREVVDVVRGKNAQRAIDTLSFSHRKCSKDVMMLIRSAVNNAAQNRGVNVDTLYVKRIFVDQGVTLKRFMTRARGGASTILKRSANLTVILEEK